MAPPPSSGSSSLSRKNQNDATNSGGNSKDPYAGLYDHIESQGEPPNAVTGAPPETNNSGTAGGMEGSTVGVRTQMQMQATQYHGQSPENAHVVQTHSLPPQQQAASASAGKGKRKEFRF